MTEVTCRQDVVMKVFVPFSEELFEFAGRHAGQTRALDDGHPAAGVADAAAEIDLGELVPFRFDYRCLRLKAQPAGAHQPA
jgi:hypothetical protein